MNRLSPDYKPRSEPSRAKKIRHIRMSDDLWVAAATKADAEGLTISELVRDLLREYVGRED